MAEVIVDNELYMAEVIVDNELYMAEVSVDSELYMAESTKLWSSHSAMSGISTTHCQEVHSILDTFRKPQ